MTAAALIASAALAALVVADVLSSRLAESRGAVETRSLYRGDWGRLVAWRRYAVGWGLAALAAVTALAAPGGTVGAVLALGITGGHGVQTARAVLSNLAYRHKIAPRGATPAGHPGGAAGHPTPTTPAGNLRRRP